MHDKHNMHYVLLTARSFEAKSEQPIRFEGSRLSDRIIISNISIVDG